VAWRPISLIEAESSSDADATVCTLVDACVEAVATALDCSEVSSAVADIASEFERICMAAAPTACTTLSICRPKSWTSFSTTWRRRSLSSSSRRFASSRLRVCTRPSLNTMTARAMAPISSWRVSPAMAAS
jgi:hypothetical protein